MKLQLYWPTVRQSSRGGAAAAKCRKNSCRKHSMGKLKRFLLRYFPPGIILEYEQNGEVRRPPPHPSLWQRDLLRDGAAPTATRRRRGSARARDRARVAFTVAERRALLATAAQQLRQKPVDLLTLTPETDVEVLVDQIVRSEPLISESRKPQLRKLIYKLIEKVDTADQAQNFYLFKILRAQ